MTADVATPERLTREARVLDVAVVVVLAITAVLTAWSGFQSSKWGGEMSIAFSRASSARIEAARHAATADAARGYDLNVFGVYVQAVATDDDAQADFVRQRFSAHFTPAFEEWLATSPLQNPSAPKSPFVLDSYRPPGAAEAAEADARADEWFDRALVNNQRGDNYTLLTVLFALVLFFTAVAGRPRQPRLRWVVLGLAVVLLLVGIGFLITFPKII